MTQKKLKQKISEAFANDKIKELPYYIQNLIDEYCRLDETLETVKQIKLDGDQRYKNYLKLLKDSKDDYEKSKRVNRYAWYIIFGMFATILIKVW